MINEDWYWPGLSESNLGARVGFSVYLPDLIGDAAVRQEWEEDLRRDVAAATLEALSIDKDDIAWTAEIGQVGPTAQEFHEVFVWIEDLPKEVLTGLLVIGAERSLSAVYGWLKHRMESRRRQFQDTEVRTGIEFHSSTLAELCKEHAVRRHGARIRQTEVWNKKSEGLSPAEAWSADRETPFLIVLQSETNEFSYLVKPDGSVLEFRVDGSKALPPILLQEISTPLDDSIPFATPQGFNWPSQDMVDRSANFAILAKSRLQLEQHTREAVSEVLPDLDSARFQAEDHEIGPAAGAVEDFVVTLFENRDAFAMVLDGIVDTWAAYEIVTRVRNKLMSAGRRSGDRGACDPPWFPAGTLAMICEEYVRRRYHPRAHLTTEWYCLTREFYAGYVSPGHPTESIEYLVIVSTSKESYRFKLLGTAKVLSHSVRRGRLDTELPTPDLFDAVPIEEEE